MATVEDGAYIGRIERHMGVRTTTETGLQSAIRRLRRC
jgi:hypothetical protein